MSTSTSTLHLPAIEHSQVLIVGPGMAAQALCPSALDFNGSYRRILRFPKHEYM